MTPTKTVDMSSMAAYLLEYNEIDRYVKYKLPEDFELDIDRIKNDFGPESTLKWESDKYNIITRTVTLYLLPEINYVI